MFVFNNLLELATWLEQCEQALSGKAGNEKGSKLQFTKGQIHELKNLTALIRGGQIVFKEPEPKTVYVENKKEEKSERPSAANNDFLRWVRQNYSVKLYQAACSDIAEGKTEDEVRKMLSGWSK